MTLLAAQNVGPHGSGRCAWSILHDAHGLSSLPSAPRQEGMARITGCPLYEQDGRISSHYPLNGNT